MACLVFTSPTAASVIYDLVIEDWNDFPNRLGQALLIDGRWQVSRATGCNDLSLAGVTCD